MSIVAVNMQTESGDNYLSLFTGVVSVQVFVSRVEAEMGEELAFVWKTSIVVDDEGVNAYKHALQERIEQLSEAQ